MKLVKKNSKKSRVLSQEASSLYATDAVRALAMALIGIYLPIYIFQLSAGHAIFSSDQIINGLVWICLFYLVTSVTAILVIIVSVGTLFNKFHLKNSLFIGIIFKILSLVFLLLSKDNTYFLIPSAIFMGFRIPFYWIPYHIFFIRRADDGDHKYGTEIGRKGFFSGIATSLAPLLGGLIIATFGFDTLFFISMILLTVASLPTLLYVSESNHKTHTFKEVYKNFIANKKYFYITVGLFGRVTSGTICMIFWSLMLFLKLTNFVDIGFLNTISGILATVLLLVVGRIIDLKGKKKLHFVAVIINSILHITRPFLTSTTEFYVNNILDRINASTYVTSFAAATYERTSNKNASDFIIYREVVLHMARFIVLLLIIPVILVTGTWKWVFFVGAIGSGLSFLINF